ncbi:hypothetical protein PIIN_04291 [Serendipita indica DSM 11827]|uniref:Uncharacterized protein n=1 Tax=Serendipita indica (strain DSM 11827) TaxID=1109443 RepID=G4TGC5_SERID|nr:hypothetical protein PIIN_04291 [Serendipita indica DSM 11827]
MRLSLLLPGLLFALAVASELSLKSSYHQTLRTMRLKRVSNCYGPARKNHVIWMTRICQYESRRTRIVTYLTHDARPALATTSGSLYVDRSAHDSPVSRVISIDVGSLSRLGLLLSLPPTPANPMPSNVVPLPTTGSEIMLT